MLETRGQKLTRDEFIEKWAKENNPHWPISDWDYTEWDECLDSYANYLKRIEDEWIM